MFKTQENDDEIISVTPDDAFLDKTIIKKFSIKGNDIKYVGSAKIIGRLINQFAMDESNNHLRVAYTRDSSSGSEVAVFNNNMKEVGKLKGIAPTERIYSARFMGDKLYLVTFKETDPFFVIDLKNPKKPEILGYLKIPGFSDYLHPYDKDHIIGFGQSTEENQFNGVSTTGMKIAMFDVTDLKNPKQISNIEIGSSGTHSDLLYNHKALMYNQKENYFGFPVTVTQLIKIKDAFPEPKNIFQGGLVYEIDKDFNIKFKGKTTHKNESEYDIYSHKYSYMTEVKRLVYVGDYIYSISDQYISSNKASDMSFVQKIE